MGIDRSAEEAVLERALRHLAADFRRIADRQVSCSISRNLPFLRQTPRPAAYWIDPDHIDEIRWRTDPAWAPECPTFVECHNVTASYKEERWQLVIAYDGHCYEDELSVSQEKLDRSCERHHDQLSLLGGEACRLVSNAGLYLPGFGVVRDWSEGELFEWMRMVFHAAWSHELGTAVSATRSYPSAAVAGWLRRKYYVPQGSRGVEEVAKDELACWLRKSEEKRIAKGEYASFLGGDPCNTSSDILEFLADQLRSRSADRRSDNSARFETPSPSSCLPHAPVVERGTVRFDGKEFRGLNTSALDVLHVCNQAAGEWTPMSIDGNRIRKAAEAIASMPAELQAVIEKEPAANGKRRFNPKKVQFAPSSGLCAGDCTPEAHENKDR
ncbi:hypothetical protein [Aeoliella mucimassa]|uniref:Uncharacterized protein n=1 Tax=Aeoliella mucimassa TaxID=2527972 RepID=A0A518AN27_9BACT|nr:hypothetical protein [Aeoliella mucimassa]QDU56137.1 hypothetical protein Pan181_23410 [Aeoliella mucimassa]